MSGASFQIAPLTTVIAPGELEAWLDAAETGARQVYASGLVAPKGDETFALARQMYDEGLVQLLTERREDRKGTNWLVQRRAPVTGKAVSQGAAKDPLADETEEEAVMRVVRRRIRLRQPMATDAEIARELSLAGPDRASYLLRKLKVAGWIIIASRGPRERRVVTDVASGRSTIEGGL